MRGAKVRWSAQVAIHSVSDLYARYAALDVPGYYEQGEQNPWAGLCHIVPVTAKAYVVILKTDETALAFARAALKAYAGRKKPKEVVCDKNTANYNQFSKPGDVIVLFA